MKALTRSAALVAVFVIAALFVIPAPAAAQGPSVFDFNKATADVAIVTTTEKDIIASNLTNTPRDEVRVVILCWAQLTTGTNTTGVTPHIRRGTGIAGTLLTEANAETIKVAAGGTEMFFWMASEQRAATSIQYSCTLTQAAASANGSVLQAAILVLAQ